jgi:molecular chaperone GrpE (heat shock protein)
MTDLEEAIMRCWQIVDDLDLAIELIEDNDEASKLILGIKAIYEIKFSKLWKAFENSIK